MSKLKFLTIGLLLSLVFVTSCKDDEEIIINEAEVLATYLEANGDFINTYTPALIKADDVLALNATGGVYIMDIRSAADFAAGHIDKAVNVPLADLISHYDANNLSTYQKVVVACYSGQTASYGASLMRIAGYDNVYSLKWGMSSWNPVFDKWTANLSNARATQFVTDPATKNAVGELPVLNTTFTTGADILKARVESVLLEGFDPGKITNATVFDNTANYYIVNYWLAEHYAIGHIPGAIQYTPNQSWKLATDLKTLPTDKPVVVYCYSGQTSAFVAAYLRVLGYDAKSLMAGGNGMIYDIMKDNSLTTFSDADIHDYAYVTE